jgi:hypothetical protein
MMIGRANLRMSGAGLPRIISTAFDKCVSSGKPIDLFSKVLKLLYDFPLIV